MIQCTLRINNCVGFISLSVSSDKLVHNIMNPGESDDKSVKEVEKQSGEELDHFLEYGKYQAIRVWVFGSFLGTFTPFVL